MSDNGFSFGRNDMDKITSRVSGSPNLGIDNNVINNPIGMHIALITNAGDMHSLWLPYPPEGKYTFPEHSDSTVSEMLFFEAVDNKWIANCVYPFHFSFLGGKITYLLELADRCIYTIEKFDEKYVLYAEKANEESLVFHNYYVDKNVDIFVGRLKNNDIVYPNSRVSKYHAIIRWENNSWKVIDRTSSNGTFVNDIRISEGNYNVGDVVYIMGLRVILGVGFISINDGNNRIYIKSLKLRKVKSVDLSSDSGKSCVQHTKTKLFNRLPRRRVALDAKPISVEAPPLSLNSSNIPLLLRMGSPLVMSSTSLLAGNITSMLSLVLFPVLTQKYSEKQRKEYEERRVVKYKEYLSKKKKELDAEIIREERVLNHNYPQLAQVLSYSELETRLWERRKTDDDFLTLRLGHGKIPMIAKCDFPDRSFEIDEDPLLEKMYELVEAPLYIQQIPIMSSFVDDNVCGVLGNRKLEIDFVRQLIMQMTLLHSYDEVKIIVLINKNELEQLEFIKYLPHIWSDQRDFRFLAVDTKGAFQISEYLKREIGELIEKSQELKEILKKRPYYFVFALDKRIFDSMEVLKDVVQSEKNCGVTVLTVFDDLPKECVKIFDLKDSGEHSVIYLKQIEKKDDMFQLDTFEPSVAMHSMNKISNMNLKILSQSYSLPKMISFLEMFKVGKVEHLNPLKRWYENNPVISLAAPVGVDTEGNLFTLDLHEKYQGPHGLVAGMTGSGKSEFIITYILSMAVNFHPDEVAFILIDYKGGGLAGAFEDKVRGIHLPHLLGTITNLDGAAIQRSLMSIQSELMRRQRIFNDAKSLSNEGTMDIYTYQRLYRSKRVAEPLPHLFIISDEFAELKAQEPDFMDQLISAARIGRSLGIHLILATQKPAGVVNDQIWSNTKFRVCLKVQDRGDSVEMLKRPEAAELKNIGRFYLQVGYNEFFALGQSAWCGAPYLPQDTVIVQKDDEIQFIDSVGQAILKTGLKSETKDSGLKQIVAIVQYLSELASREGIKTRSLWKEPLSTCIGVENIISEYNIRKKEEIEIPLGIVDDPYNQIQYPFFLNFQKCRNYLIVGSSGSGKTTLIQTVLYMLVRDYTPEQINFYILDFSSRNLISFRKMPHCGAVLMDENEAEVDRLVTMLEGMVEQRKKMFADTEVSSYDAYIKVSELPLIMLVIDNLSAMDEFKKGRDLLERITSLMRNGGSYGVKVIATVANLNDCLYRMQHEFGNMIALQANDRYAYSNILNVHCKYEPSQTAGRGMCVIDGECLEFQTALISDCDDEQKRSVILREKLKQFAIEYSGKFKALQIEVAKEDETFDEFCELFSGGRLPLGYNLESGEKIAVPLQQLNSVSLYFGNTCGTHLVLRNFLRSAQYNGMKVLVVHKLNNSLFENVKFLDEVDQDRKLIHYKCTVEGIESLNNDLIAMFIDRTPVRKKICNELGIGSELENWRNPDAIKQWRRYMRSETQPVLVIFESILDFELTITPELVGKYKTNFTMSRGYNIYYCGCFYAEDQAAVHESTKVRKNEESLVKQVNTERIVDHVVNEETPEEIRAREIRQAVNTIKECFNEDKFTLLFGGQYDRQNLVDLPYEYRTITFSCKLTDYSRFLMYYRDKTVRMQMPIGKIETDIEDEDELSII